MLTMELNIMDSITIIRPDDWHLHLRDDQALVTSVPAAARGFGRGIIMPNLTPSGHQSCSS